MSAKKIVVLGDFGVGKTSLVRRYVLDEFSDDYRATLGVHLYKYSEDFDGARGITCDLVLWDIEGTPTPDVTTSRYLTGASGALVVGDRTRSDPKDTMERAARLFETARPGRPVLFALNKADLGSTGAVVACEKLARQFGTNLIETSALSGEKVKDAFRQLAEEILARNV